MKRFEGQVAMVVGGARGIGKKVAERLLLEGARVYLVDILEKNLEQCKLEFKEIGLNVSICTANICEENEILELVERVIEESNRIDILVNAAGIVGPSATKILDYSLQDFQKVLEVNLTGAFIVTKAVLPQMIEQNYGRILHFTSIGGKEGNPGMVGYAASKSGMMGLVKGTGKEYAETGITINGIAPAVISTPMNKDTDPKMIAYMTSKIPMGRLGTTTEAAALSCWIVSKEASFNTGFVFDLSGGRATY